MGKNSKIEWTHHTFNPWWGCTKVSAACSHCYAEAWAKRVGADVWGPRASRRFFSNGHWQQPVAWNAEAATVGERRRVFCASMADVFEARTDLEPSREKLWAIIEATPYLDWLLLTKRPNQVRAYVPWGECWPANVWLGTTVESQHWAEQRIPELAECPAAVRFLSCEPLLGPLDLRSWLGSAVQWVIAGGESGAGSRPSHPKWFRCLRDQCVAAGVPFHFKQWGNWAPLNGHAVTGSRSVRQLRDGEKLVRLNKVDAGRALDGKIWDQLPYHEALRLTR
jgi:protein gp37